VADWTSPPSGNNRQCFYDHNIAPQQQALSAHHALDLGKISKLEQPAGLVHYMLYQPAPIPMQARTRKYAK